MHALLTNRASSASSPCWVASPLFQRTFSTSVQPTARHSGQPNATDATPSRHDARSGSEICPASCVLPVRNILRHAQLNLPNHIGHAMVAKSVWPNRSGQPVRPIGPARPTMGPLSPPTLPHVGAVSVEDARDLDAELVLTVIVEEQGL